MRESTNPDSITDKLFDTIVQGYQRQSATSIVVNNILGNFSDWLLQFIEITPNSDEDFAYNHALDDILEALDKERG